MEINEPINQQQKLNVMAIVDASEYGRAALRYGEKLAEVFSATLTVIRHFGFSLEKRGEPAEVELTTGEYRVVRDDYFFPERLYRVADELNTIMFVIGVDGEGKQGLFTKRRALRFIKPSRLPVMTVGREGPRENAYKQVILPLDIARQAKEEALWAGIFSRFYGATIHILHIRYEEKSMREQVENNLAFVQKLYENLEVKYVVDEVDPCSDIDAYSLEFAAARDMTLSVVMMTRYFTLADLFFGPHERKVIGNDRQFPVLCINQRDDLYVLCT